MGKISNGALLALLQREAVLSPLASVSEMKRFTKKSLSLYAIVAYVCICAALALLTTFILWESYRDFQIMRGALLEAEVNRLRSHAERTVGRIERDLETGRSSDISSLIRHGWLKEHFAHLKTNDRRGTYAAVVNDDAVILAHTDPTRQNKRLGFNWYNRILFEIGKDVVETHSPILTNGEETIDVRVPIKIQSEDPYEISDEDGEISGENQGEFVGEFHTGFSLNWFDRWSAEKQVAYLKRRGLLIGGVLVVVLLAATSLYYLASHSFSLRQAVNTTTVERATEVGKLAAGLAHEVRNPLHAIQLNLHALRRSHERGSMIPPQEMTDILVQSSREIERIEWLMQQLLGFATPDDPRHEFIDLKAELKELVNFLEEEMLREDVELVTQLPGYSVTAHLDRGRFRQIMLNLLQNAQQAMEEGGPKGARKAGRIVIALERRRRKIEISVTDNGPGISEVDRERIFDPFFSTKEEGTGLGLALVKRFVTEVNGEIFCETNSEGGTTFHILLDEVQHSKVKT